jgi:hypothetical protein
MIQYFNHTSFHLNSLPLTQVGYIPYLGSTPLIYPSIKNSTKNYICFYVLGIWSEFAKWSDLPQIAQISVKPNFNPGPFNSKNIIFYLCSHVDQLRGTHIQHSWCRIILGVFWRDLGLEKSEHIKGPQLRIQNATQCEYFQSK